MLEYTYDEALELLTNNFTNAKETVESLDTDLDFIKDQITTTEVNIARVYNQDVREKRAKKEERENEKGEGGEEGEKRGRGEEGGEEIEEENRIKVEKSKNREAAILANLK